MGNRTLESALNSRVDLRQMARILAKTGRGNDRMLAHISPREARILKAAGGSGTINPATGLLEFDDSGSYFDASSYSNPSASYNSYQSPDYSLSAGTSSSMGLSGPSSTPDASYNSYQSPDYSLSAGMSPSVGLSAPSTNPSSSANSYQSPDYSLSPGLGSGVGLTAPASIPSYQSPQYSASMSASAPQTTNPSSGSQSQYSLTAGMPPSVGLQPSTAIGLQPTGIGADQLLNQAANPGSATGQPTTSATPSQSGSGILSTLLSRVGNSITSPSVIEKLLTSGIGGVAAGALANHAANQATASGQQISQQYNNLGNPLIQQGKNLINMGQSGQLLPSQQQALQALRAQMEQELASRGVQSSTAEQQISAAIQNQAQVYAQDLVNQGLQLLQLGNSYAAQGIQAEYQSNTQAQQLSYQFAQELANLFAGAFNSNGQAPSPQSGSVQVQQ